MNRITRLISSCATVLLVLLIDRVTKWLALCMLENPVLINKYISFELAFNRGISGGLFHFTDTFGFFLVSALVTSILVAITIWTWRVYQRGGMIIGQLLIIAGGFSNILDRIIHGGVVDFISVSFNTWHWALFNIADVSINIGVIILLLQNFLTKDHE